MPTDAERPVADLAVAGLIALFALLGLAAVLLPLALVAGLARRNGHAGTIPPMQP